ncbi:hypothetical protein [Falsiroseomonas oryzae]|nr:hypothetical protein [Roseomonas sp. MO-31]
MLFSLVLLGLLAVGAILFPDAPSPSATLRNDLTAKHGWGPMGQ